MLLLHITACTEAYTVEPPKTEPSINRNSEVLSGFRTQTYYLLYIKTSVNRNLPILKTEVIFGAKPKGSSGENAQMLTSTRQLAWLLLLTVSQLQGKYTGGPLYNDFMYL